MSREEQYSVLMCVYGKDNPEWFDLAIDSMVSQTFPPAQFVIVEDGPVPQQIEAVISKYREQYPELFHLVKLEANVGLGEALRIGVPQCRYEWIARMDADDYSVADRIEKQFYAAARENADIVGCDVAEFTGFPDEEHKKAVRVFPEKHIDILKFGRRRTPFAHPGVLMRKSRILSAGNYQSAYLHEDFDLFIRMLRDGCIGYTVKETLVFMRVGDDFYARRGGIRYLNTLLKYNWKQYRDGWMGMSDFAIRSASNIAFCLMPNHLRDVLYRRLLRK